MSSVIKSILALIIVAANLPCLAASELRVCADPNNLPYSNDQKQGFENQLASLIGKDLNMQVTYFWFPQREAFFKKTLNSGVCDVVMGVPAGFDEADTTRPYYRSSYAFISRRDRHLHITSFDDPRLRTLKIGVHILGEQDDSLPPVHAFTSRGIVRNLVGFSIFGNLNEKNPPAELIKAVADGKVDVAVAWGPLAGYFIRQSRVPLEITPIDGDPTLPNLPFHFDIAIGVREGDQALKQSLDAELVRRRAAIHKILNSYGIPQFDEAAAASSPVGED
jgi:quinoprotein dehydrogenase-associated probable ABC transporter substrate-binding protein